MRDTVAALVRNPISQLGSALALVSAILFVTIMLIELLGTEGHPYVGIITYLILPAVFVLGLVMIPLGIRRERRRSDEAITVFDIFAANWSRPRFWSVNVFHRNPTSSLEGSQTLMAV